MGMVQASTSGPVNAGRLTVPFRKQKQEYFTPVGNHGSKKFARPENASNISWQVAMNGRMQTDAGKAHIQLRTFSLCFSLV